MESTLAQYGLSGVILWLMFKDIIRPLVASLTKKNETTPDPEKPWNPWQSNVENRVGNLEDTVSEIKESQKNHTEMLTKIDRTMIRMAVKLNVDDEE